MRGTEGAAGAVVVAEPAALWGPKHLLCDFPSGRGLQPLLCLGGGRTGPSTSRLGLGEPAQRAEGRDRQRRGVAGQVCRRLREAALRKLSDSKLGRGGKETPAILSLTVFVIVVAVVAPFFLNSILNYS